MVRFGPVGMELEHRPEREGETVDHEPYQRGPTALEVQPVTLRLPCEPGTPDEESWERGVGSRPGVTPVEVGVGWERTPAERADTESRIGVQVEFDPVTVPPVEFLWEWVVVEWWTLDPRSVSVPVDPVDLGHRTTRETTSLT